MKTRKIALLLMPLLLAACGSEATPQGVADRAADRVVERRPSEAPAPRGAALMQRAMLTMHNATRASVRLPPLVWNAKLAADATGYARVLAASGRFEHSRQPRGNPNQGENLWTGTRDAYRYDEMATHWIEERRFFVPGGVVPNVSNSGRFEDVGHYTQIIWSRTSQFGCGFASNQEDDYLVCRYLAAGNVVGQRPLP